MAYTKQQLEDLVDNKIAQKIYWELKDANCDYDVRVKYDKATDQLIPYVTIDTHDDYFIVKVETRAIKDEDFNQGWEFIPTINNAGIRETIDMDNQGNVGRRFKRWAQIAACMEDLFTLEIYPDDYYYGDDDFD